MISIIFNATFEFVFQRWNARLNYHGWMVAGRQEERLTHTRYANHMLWLATNLPDLQAMLQLLQDELASCGLEMHESKTNILSSHNDTGLDFFDIEGLLIEIPPVDKAHRYLCRMLSTSLERDNIKLQHRLKLAW